MEIREAGSIVKVTTLTLILYTVLRFSPLKSLRLLLMWIQVHIEREILNNQPPKRVGVAGSCYLLHLTYRADMKCASLCLV